MVSSKPRMRLKLTLLSAVICTLPMANLKGQIGRNSRTVTRPCISHNAPTSRLRPSRLQDVIGRFDIIVVNVVGKTERRTAGELTLRRSKPFARRSAESVFAEGASTIALSTIDNASLAYSPLPRISKLLASLLQLTVTARMLI